MSVGLKTAVARLAEIIEATPPKTAPAVRFVRRLDNEPAQERRFSLEPGAPGRDSYTGRSFRVPVTLVMSYVGQHVSRLTVQAGEDQALVQRTLVDPAQHGGPHVSGVIAVSSPTSTSLRRVDGGLVAAMVFDLIYLESP